MSQALSTYWKWEIGTWIHATLQAHGILEKSFRKATESNIGSMESRSWIHAPTPKPSNKQSRSSKFKKWPHYGQNTQGRIMLQDHGTRVEFKELKIKRLQN
jgi:hypothetical protein